MFAKKSFQSNPLISFGFMSFVVTLTITLSCRKEQATGPANVSKSDFVQKIVYGTFTSTTAPFLNKADLYEADGTYRLDNTTKFVDGSFACIAPDESWLVYTYNSQWPRLMRINMDGTDQREIVLSQSDSFIQMAGISSDGKSIAIIYQRFHQFDGLHVGVMGINGENFHPVFVDSSQCGPVTWSPDGRVFFQWYDWKNRFTSNPPQAFLARSYICSVNVDGTGWRVISDTTSGLSNDKMPRVSPDGKFIVFTSPRTYFPQYLLEEIFVMNIDGSNVRNLTNVTFRRNGDHFDYYTTYDCPEWLNDSKHIVFQFERDTYDTSLGRPVPSMDLYVMKIDGTGLQQLTNDGRSVLLKR